MSATPLAFVSKSGLILAAGTTAWLDLTGATVITGADYWGAAGTALPLAVTVNAVGHVEVPAGDYIYDLWVGGSGHCDPADLGKMVQLTVLPNSNSFYDWVPVALPGGGGLPTAQFGLSGTDHVFAGDGPVGVRVQLDGTALTCDMTDINLAVLVTQRPG
jgi:hypothetical protein